jgi:hypothetical protein
MLHAKSFSRTRAILLKQGNNKYGLLESAWSWSLDWAFIKSLISDVLLARWSTCVGLFSYQRNVMCGRGMLVRASDHPSRYWDFPALSKWEWFLMQSCHISLCEITGPMWSGHCHVETALKTFLERSLNHLFKAKTQEFWREASEQRLKGLQREGRLPYE